MQYNDLIISVDDFWLIRFSGELELRPVKVLRFYDNESIVEVYEEGGKPSTKFYEYDDLIWRFKLPSGPA